MNSDIRENFLSLNTLVFDRELIFSYDSKVFSDEIYNIFGECIGRFNPSSNTIFFYFFKDNSRYPEVAMKIRNMNYNIMDSKDIIWARFFIPHTAEENLGGKRINEIEETIVYPFIVMKEGRIYFIVQYKSSSEEEISERLFAINSFYESKFWSGSFRIDYMGKSRVIKDILNSLNMNINLKVVNITLRKRKEPLEIFRNYVTSVKWPTIDEGKIKIMSLQEILNMVEATEETIRKFFDMFVKRTISSLYLETRISEEKIELSTIIEDDLIEGMIDNFYNINGGANIDIKGIFDYNNEKITARETNYLNSKLLRKQLIFSVDISKAYPEYSQIMNEGITYYDYESRKYYFSILKNEERYNEQKMKIRNIGNIMHEDNNMLWISYENVTYNNKEIKNMLLGKTLSEMENVVLYPFSIINNGRTYHLCQFNESSSPEVSERIISLSASFNRILGSRSLIIHHIGESQSVAEFISQYYDRSKVQEIEISIPSELNAEGIQKNHSYNFNNIYFIVKVGESIADVKIDALLQGLGIPKDIMSENLKNISDNYAIALYFESICDSGECKIKWLYEKRYVPYVLKILAEINKNGKYIKLKKFITLQT